MKKLLVFFFLFFSAYLLTTRFIEVDNPIKPGSNPSILCGKKGEPAEPAKNLYPCATLEAINRQYLTEIKPIFAAKCLMCHGITAKIPLYAKIPPSSFLIQNNMVQAKSHLSMVWDFPFHGEEAHENQDKALKEIKEVVEENAMPPWSYKLMHWKSSLIPGEKQKILSWVSRSRNLLNSKN